MRSCLFAFDLNKKKFAIMLKAYINCFRKAHILEISPAVILFDSIRRLPGREDEKIALDKLEAFLMPREGGFEGMSVELRDEAYMIRPCQRQRSDPVPLFPTNS